MGIRASGARMFCGLLLRAGGEGGGTNAHMPASESLKFLKFNHCAAARHPSRGRCILGCQGEKQIHG